MRSTEQVGHKRMHAGRREQHARIVVRNNRGARQDGVTVQSLLEEMAEMYMRQRGSSQSFFPPDWGGWEFEKAKDKEKQRKRERSQ